MQNRLAVLLAIVLTVSVVAGGVGATIGASEFRAPDGGFSNAGPADNRPANADASPGERSSVESSPAGASAAVQQSNCNFTNLYDRTIDAVVSIRVATPAGFGQGSGFVYDGEGRIVTNQHVVENASRVEVQFDRGEWRTAEVVGTDAYSDLAVLRVKNVPNYVEPLSLADAPAEPGQRVAALGSPLGLQASITEGVVSGVNRSLPSEQGFTIPDTIQTDAAINPGNSGGPLVDCAGNVVGVNTAGIAGSENLGFAIPASVVSRVAGSLVENGSYRHAFLGVGTVGVSPTVARANDLQRTRGVLVVNTVPGSPASGALEASADTRRVGGIAVPVGGDVLLAIDGQRVGSSEDLSSYLAANGRPGERVELTVLRNGERRNVTVRLDQRPPPG